MTGLWICAFLVVCPLQHAADDSSHGVDAERKPAIKLALDTIRKGPPKERESLEDVLAAAGFEKAVAMAAEHKATEAIDDLVSFIAYHELVATGSRGRLMMGFPAAEALARIGPRSVPALLKKAAAVNDAVAIRNIAETLFSILGEEKSLRHIYSECSRIEDQGSGNPDRELSLERLNEVANQIKRISPKPMKSSSGG